jgi:hypothetical protein
VSALAVAAVAAVTTVVVGLGLYLRWAVRPVVGAFRLGLATAQLTQPAAAGRGRHRADRKERTPA